SEIHAQNIVHRDLKTSNVMITNTGQVKIIDFGIAISDDSSRFTQTGKVIGSVHYLAPELIDKQEASPQSDIYALGIILYEMLIGNPPHRGKTPIETALKHKTEPIPQVNKIYPNIPQALSNIVVKATAKKKELRYQSMRQLEADLADCLSQKRMTEKPIVLDDKPAIKRFGLFSRRK
ncbi:MAG: serine/threonine protein kinase, partial [Mycoplasmataceae bacterium]|nr:serine/threonine protein kinase [Mycoplasmataceae bacterium]